MKEEKLALLNRLFSQFSEPLRRFLYEHTRERTFQEGEVIMEPGQALNFSVLVIRGRIKVYNLGPEGEEFFLYYLEPGEACALSFICMANRKNSEILAVASEETQALLLPLESLKALMDGFPEWFSFVLETYRSRFNEVLELVKNVAFRSLDERLLFYLQKQRKAFNSDLIPLTHEQIANDLNSSRVVISRLLKQLEHNGKVKLLRQAIVLVRKEWEQ